MISLKLLLVKLMTLSNNTTTVTDFFTVDSSVATIQSGHYAQYGKVAELVIYWTNKNAISVPTSGNIDNITIGTLKTGKRPVMSTGAYSHGDNAGQAWYVIPDTGAIQLAALEGSGSSRTIAAGTWFSLHATYLVP